MNHKNGSLSLIARHIPATLSALAGAMLLIWVVSSNAQNRRQPKNQPQVQSATEGPKFFEAICAGCHGLDGRGGEHGPDIAGRPEVQRLSDAETLRILKNGRLTSGMPAFGSLGDEKLKALVRYLRTLQGKGGATIAAGDPQRGKANFFGKARCSECHMVHGAGGFLGSDLSAYGQAHPTAEIRSAIVNPDGDLDPRRRVVAVNTRDGEKHTGIARNEDNFSLQLQSLDGTFHLLAKSDIERMEIQPKTLMPADYGSTLDTNELDDLVSYLVSAAKREKRAVVKKRKWEDEDNN